jgi:hypothetical protein
VVFLLVRALQAIYRGSILLTTGEPRNQARLASQVFIPSFLNDHPFLDHLSRRVSSDCVISKRDLSRFHRLARPKNSGLKYKTSLGRSNIRGTQARSVNVYEFPLLKRPSRSLLWGTPGIPLKVATPA